MRLMKHWPCRTIAFAVYGAFLLPRALLAEDPTEFSRLKDEACRPYDAEFQRDAIAAKDDPQWLRFEERLSLIDRVALLVVADCETYKANELLHQTGVSLGSGSLATRSPEGALKLLDRYTGDFSSALPLPNLGQRELSFLSIYYQACLNARVQYVYLHGQAVAAADPQDTRHILELCMVLPFLKVADGDWKSADIEALPSWMQPRANRRAIEALAICAHRLHTGFQFGLYEATANASALNPRQFTTYLNSAADLAIARGDDAAAIFTLRTAIGDAKTADFIDVIPALAPKLAQVLAATGDTKAAAEEMTTAMNDHATSNSYGTLAALRLQYLYESAQYSAVLSEASIYRSDPRCESALPQILYTAWTASRRLGAGSDSGDGWSRAFLDQFPDHPLGAQIFFAAATQALANDHRDEAIKLFHYILYHYPQLNVASKALDIEHRLTASGPSSPG